MSLVEATIILMVLAILTSVVSPSIADYVNDSRGVKAKEDVEALGTGIVRLLRDTGKACIPEASATPCTIANKVELLISGSIAGATATNGEIDAGALGVTTAAAGVADAASAATLNWGAAGSTDRPTSVQTFDQHLVTNADVAYTGVSFTGGGGPRAGLGWRGAYVSGPIGLDPWGRKYQANTVWIGVATDSGVVVTTNEGGSEGGFTRDTIVITPGANGLVETGFALAASTAGGDDVTYVIKGSTR
jgi:type II secretory pathway pseudopilin PulG